MSDEERENKKVDTLINSEEISTKVPNPYRDGKRKKKWDLSLDLHKTNDPNIKREVYRVGIKVFLLFSIPVALITIYYLIYIFPYEIRNDGFSYRMFDYILLEIFIWLSIILGITIPAMIGKRLLYTENKKRVFMMPVMTFVICVILGIIWIFIKEGS
jgi:hypothetical protein